MTRTARFMPIAALALCWLATAAPARADEADEDREPPAAPTVTAFGQIRFDVDLTATGSLAGGTIVSMTAGAFAWDFGHGNTSSVSVTAKVAGGKVKAEITMPYRWVLGSRRARISVFLTASAADLSDGAGHSSRFDQDVQLPDDGAVRVVRITGAI